MADLSFDGVGLRWVGGGCSDGTSFGGCNVEDGGMIAVGDVVDNRAARLSSP